MSTGKKRTLIIPSDLWLELDQMAFEKNTSKSAIVRRFIEELKEQGDSHSVIRSMPG